MTMPVPALEPAFNVAARLGPLEDHGTTRAGHRRVVPIAGGQVSGMFDAEILPGGADWQLVRADGTVEIDTRYTARTPQGSTSTSGHPVSAAGRPRFSRRCCAATR